MMQASSVISLSSPSFNSYSNSEFAEIAARVVEEFGSDEYYDEFYFERDEDCGTGCAEENEKEKEKERDVVYEERDCDVEMNVNGADDAEDDGDFEFAFVSRDSELSSPISADEIFHNGQIRPCYPVFNRDFFNREGNGGCVRSSYSEKVRLPLRKLFIEERETTVTRTSSTSSSDADDLEGIPSDSYCVWRPREAAAAASMEGRCKKSSSSGNSNSKRWKLKNLLRRSQSDGAKDNSLILSPSNSGRKNEEKVKSTVPAPAAVKSKPKAATSAATSPPPLYIRDGGDKRRSYLPYRQDLVGIFSNVNGLSKNLQPF